MKKILHKKNLFLAIMLLGAISMNAQAYEGKPYPTAGTPLQIGVIEDTGYRLEMENFDQTTANANGINVTYTGTGTPPLTGTYYDKSAGNTGESPATGRGGDVDTKLDATGTVLTGGQGQEYTLYTIQIMETGNYTLKFNYKHSAGSGKSHQLFYVTQQL